MIFGHSLHKLRDEIKGPYQFFALADHNRNAKITKYDTEYDRDIFADNGNFGKGIAQKISKDKSEK